MSTTVYVDMDGVLANFNKAGCKTFGLEYPKQSRLWHTWLQDQSGVSLHGWFETMAADPTIWDRIEPFPWTPQLVQCLDIHAPGWKILSSATHDPKCWSAKADWVINRLFPITSLHRLVLVGGRKFELANRGDVLIDDWQENIDHWMQRGGVAFKWEEFTEDMEDHAAAQIDRLREFLTFRNRLH